LRPATLDDLDAWHAISREAEEAWWGAASSTREDARVNLAKHMSHQEVHGFSLWVVELNTTHEVIGATGLKHLEDGPEIELGYRFLQEYWGQGYATEAARASIGFGFDELGLEEIVAVTLATNKGSRRVMEKCGLTFVGRTAAYGHTQVKYAIRR
jgi:RimJ/RimL family protein N-acetyltransferase